MADHDRADEELEHFLGMPMRWVPRKLFRNIWNPQEPRVFPPKYFGVGWDLNFHALAKKARLVK
jgi:hypothetical protein